MVDTSNGRALFSVDEVKTSVVDAATFAGSCTYMAPEMFRKGDQTPKSDVWSLFVTTLWILNVGEFRWKSDQFRFVEDAQEGGFICSLQGGYGFENSGDGNHQPERTWFCSPDACQVLRRSRTQYSTESGPSSHEQPFFHSRCLQSFSPSFSLANLDCAS